MAKKLMTETEKIVLEARNEVNEEVMAEYKEKLKIKLRALASAKKIVSNYEREIEDLQIAIDQDLS